jgi:hypothetical protein
MRAQELIQAILSLIDQTQEPQQEPMIAISLDAEQEQPGDVYDDELRRMKQIAGLQDPGEMSPLSNAPNPQYADVDAVTVDAGGGPNAPKHPHDIRVKDPSAYPNQQEC